MRFGISATSLMCPKNLRTRLRPVNVCCAIVASHFGALQGGAPSERDAVTPGLYFDPFEGRKTDSGVVKVLNSFFRPLKRKTTRGAQKRTRPSDPFLYGLQKPEIAQSPNGFAEGNAAAPTLAALSCCLPDMG